MNAVTPIPTANIVRAAIERFDQEHELAEQTLAELFHQYPRNSDPRHVLLKVLAIDSLYHTAIFALEPLARHIHEHHLEIDAAMAAGSHEIVHKIARVNVNGKQFNFFAFATKFCSWHNPGAYPIYDSHVEHYLWNLQRQSRFAAFQHIDLWNYPKFHGIVVAFRAAHNLGSFTFKELDKFLYIQGAPPSIHLSGELHNGPGTFDFFPAEEIPSEGISTEALRA